VPSPISCIKVMTVFHNTSEEKVLEADRLKGCAVTRGTVNLKHFSHLLKSVPHGQFVAWGQSMRTRGPIREG
jgi:hypothetical protein